MGIISGTAHGDVFIDTLGATGIGNGTKRGAFAVVGEGVSAWSAVKNTTCGSTYTVDGLEGSNTNSGTCAAPFKTLSKALSVAARASASTWSRLSTTRATGRRAP